MSARRRPSAIHAGLGVALFLAGSQYCLLAGLTGTPMGCLGMAAPADASSGHCAKAAGGHCHGAAKSAPASFTSPCCVVVASTAPVELDPPQALAAVIAPAALEIAAPVPPAFRALHPSDESPPPLRRSPAPLTGRAPPLA